MVKNKNRANRQRVAIANMEYTLAHLAEWRDNDAAEYIRQHTQIRLDNTRRNLALGA